MSTSTALSQYKNASDLAATAAQVFGSTSGEAIIAEHDRLEALQAALAAVFADAVNLHGLDNARVMRYAGVRHGFHLAAFEDERELFVAGYDVNLRLRFTARARP